MKLEDVRQAVDGIPYMRIGQAKVITDVILKNQYRNILELGCWHGVSTCYMAGAVDELGGGHVTTIDLLNVRALEPNVGQLLAKIGLERLVTVFYEPTSYIWRLMRMLEEDPSPRFDFCYIDGAHNWFTDGFAFYLVDRLLKAGGLIIFDDLDWTYDSSPSLKETQTVKCMPPDERSTPQVRKVYELLVKSHPAYGEFMVRGRWAFARKTSPEATAMSSVVRTEIVYQEVYVGLGSVIRRLARKLAGHSSVIWACWTVAAA